MAELLTRHRGSLVAGAQGGDLRVAQLVDECSALADEIGVDGWSGLVVPQSNSERRRDDYALAAGRGSVQTGALAIASGVGSVNWTAVPPGLFDSADRTVDWVIEMAGPAAVSVDSGRPISRPTSGRHFGARRHRSEDDASQDDAVARATVALGRNVKCPPML